MVKINKFLSLLATSSFYTLVVGKPVEKSNSLYRRYESDYCNDLDAYLKTQNAELVGCNTTFGNYSSVRIQGSSINQDIIDNINMYDVMLDYVTFEKITNIQKNLNLEPLKTKGLYFDNKHLPVIEENQDIYIPENVLKTAKNITTLSFVGFDVSQKNINEISNLTNLTDLIFDGCTFEKNIDFTNIKNLKNLTSLILSTIFIKDEGTNRLNQFPESICQLRKLNYLSLYRNDLTTLPKCIKNLKNLEELRVHLNKLISIPKEIGNLTNLKVLFLDENQIKTIPVGIGKLTKLEELYLEGNKISSLPNELSKLANLKELNLSLNSIKKIPAFLGKLSELEKLNLRGNKVNAKDIPKALKNLPNLEILI